MKKAVLLGIILMFGAAAASAETVKTTSEKVGNFWSKEGERSGLKQSTSSWGTFWTNANPVNFFKGQQDAYNARHGASATAVAK